VDSSYGYDDEVLQTLEIDLEIADIGEILAGHGIHPGADLVVALWEWKESRVRARGDA